MGKSSVVKQVAEHFRCPLYDLRLSTIDAVDLRGLGYPVVMDDQGQASLVQQSSQGLSLDTLVRRGLVVWFRPEFLPPPDQEGRSILFLDEINLAPLAVQYAAYQLVLDRRLGNYRLPSGCFVVAAGNRPEDGTGARALPPALASRFVRIEFQMDVREWMDWAIQYGVDPDIVAFIAVNQEMLYRFDPAKDTKAWPTPRTVVFASQIWSTHKEQPWVMEALAGCCGQEWAVKFNEFVQLKSQLIDVEEILEGRSMAVPQRADLRYIVAAQLGTKAAPEHVENVLKYAQKLPAEIGVFLVRLLLPRVALRPLVLRSQEWRKWLKQNREFRLWEE